MQPSPGSAPRLSYTMVAGVPLAGPVHLEPSRVDHQMSGLSRCCRMDPQIEIRLATTHGGVRRHREVQFHQPDDGLEKSLRRMQAEMEYRPHDQGALDRGIGVDPGATATLRTASPTPARQRLLVDPQTEAPLRDQCLVVLRPVSDSVLEDEIGAARLRNLPPTQVVAADQCNAPFLHPAEASRTAREGCHPESSRSPP
jgi:hypothetical protein